MNYSTEFIKTFLQYVNKEGDCWEWKGNVSYQKKVGCKFFYNYKNYSANRIMYEIHHNVEIPSKHILSGLCENIRCINPNHFKLWHKRENVPISPPPYHQGEGFSHSKLTDEDVRKIREEYKIMKICKNGTLMHKFTQKYLAEKYDVSCTVINYVVNRKLWKHVE